MLQSTIQVALLIRLHGYSAAPEQLRVNTVLTLLTLAGLRVH